jgi:hypothetical protein
MRYILKGFIGFFTINIGCPYFDKYQLMNIGAFITFMLTCVGVVACFLYADK